MTEKEENKNKKKAAIISILVHSVLLLAFLFIIAWREPDPPLPEYGIELNFGLDNVGSGDIQPETPANENTSEEEAAPEELPEQQEVETEDAEVVEESDPAKAVVEETTTSTQESPDVVKKTVVEEKIQPVKEEKKEPVKEVKKTEEKKEVAKPADGAKGTTGESAKAESANHGDDANKVGDKGDEKGSLDARALYGNPGGGGGNQPALSIVGWIWDTIPNEKDSGPENGTVVIEFFIDENGEVRRTRIEKTTISLGAARFYQDQVQKTTFSKTSAGPVTSEFTKGTITFVIKSK